MAYIADIVPDSVFTFKVKSSKFGEFEFNLRDELYFDDSTIDQCLQRHSTTIATLSRFCEEAQLELNYLLDERERTWNTLYSGMKRSKGEDGKLLSDSRIEKILSYQESIVDIQGKIREQEHYYKSLRNVVNILDNHLKAMQTYASNRRKELNGLSYQS